MFPSCGGEPIEVRRIELLRRVTAFVLPERAEIAVAQIVGEDEDDVRPRRLTGQLQWRDASGRRVHSRSRPARRTQEGDGGERRPLHDPIMPDRSELDLPGGLPRRHSAASVYCENSVRFTVSASFW